ncbi:hypothetical protein AO935_32440 [Pseudomonas aeruginosa]|nr:hypothetical protein AO901_33395 [Pseudomonas aeruginosa]OPD77420.1 hypothetical protein AO924_35480 [Pseudomonas aeruginosa]OPD77735.1 hypothetical protein AO922_33555 [Pseudomonas aeruginosa]OPD80966.1 hypothetical protein AO935_32440 [Pseudomonas aeruginosa]OPD91662.1 hypothetical protein AO969_33275 [Pseudomonas aeruginosa]
MPAYPTLAPTTSLRHHAWRSDVVTFAKRTPPHDQALPIPLPLLLTASASSCSPCPLSDTEARHHSICGLTEDWGKNWKRIRAGSLKHARQGGEELLP